jgi:eukaryotic-like serine/threonine-protein kinase
VALARWLEVPPPLPDDAPPAVRELVGRAMAKEPTHRPADGSMFGRQLLAQRAGPAATRRSAA